MTLSPPSGDDRQVSRLLFFIIKKIFFSMNVKLLFYGSVFYFLVHFKWLFSVTNYFLYIYSK